MDFNWLSFFIGGGVFLFGFLAIMAWIVPDVPAVAAMSWIAKRRNFSKLSLFAAIGALVTFLVMVIIAVAKLLHYVQMAPWVWVMLVVGGVIFVISLITLIVTRRRNNQHNP